MELYTLTYSGVYNGDSGYYCNKNSFNYNQSCKFCGTGTKLISDIYVKSIKLKKEILRTYDDDIFVSEKIYSILIRLNCKIDFRKVRSIKSNNFIPYYLIYSTIELPIMLPKSTGIIRDGGCGYCNKDGYFNDVIIPKNIKERTLIIPLNFYYNINEIIKIYDKSDIFHTWEHFGYSCLKEEENRIIGFARPISVVKKNIKEVLESESNLFLFNKLNII